MVQSIMKSQPLSRPFVSGKELEYIREVIDSGKISGAGVFTRKCEQLLERKYGFKKALLTSSCTAALEMIALLLNIREGDEVILPSYTFPSSANAFALRGARLIFADSGPQSPNITASTIAPHITEKTKVILLVHYAGISCEMEEISKLVSGTNIHLVEDAAQAIDSYYGEKPLGTFGTLSAFSFHGTKNISCGEGGLLVINDQGFFEQAEIVLNKGTNYSDFTNGKVEKYEWVAVGSSFSASEISAAYLFAQLEDIDKVQSKRLHLWNLYYKTLQMTPGAFALPFVPEKARQNAHLFYIVCQSLAERNSLMHYLKNAGISTSFHYNSLHKSPYFRSKYTGQQLSDSDRYSDCLLRLPLHYYLEDGDVKFIAEKLLSFYKK